MHCNLLYCPAILESPSSNDTTENRQTDSQPASLPPHGPLLSGRERHTETEMDAMKRISPGGGPYSRDRGPHCLRCAADKSFFLCFAVVLGRKRLSKQWCGTVREWRRRGVGEGGGGISPRSYVLSCQKNRETCQQNNAKGCFPYRVVANIVQISWSWFPYEP